MFEFYKKTLKYSIIFILIKMYAVLFLFMFKYTLYVYHICYYILQNVCTLLKYIFELKDILLQ